VITNITRDYPHHITGDIIPQQPELGIKCHRCGQSIIPEDRHSKIGSLHNINDEVIEIKWRYFCEPCLRVIQKDLKLS